LFNFQFVQKNFYEAAPAARSQVARKRSATDVGINQQGSVSGLGKQSSEIARDRALTFARQRRRYA
jgi:hypothetical protein